jgi:uncharacterized protein YceK
MGNVPVKLISLLFVTLLAALCCPGLSSPSLAQANETILHTFTWDADGGFPWSGVAPDGKGNLFGVAYLGGITDGVCCGTVYELSPDRKGDWNYQIIYTFPDGGRIDGEAPAGGLIADSAGNVYGTTQQGDDLFGCGSVFELSPTKKGPWKETILHRFNKGDRVSGDGCTPNSWLVFDQAGNLYGTTEYGGGRGPCDQNTGGCGSVFELSPGSDGHWKETIIHRFPEGSTDGAIPLGGLVFDHAGNLWGTTESAYGNNTILSTAYELSPGKDGKWKETALYPFTGNSTGWLSMNGLTIDASGNLYGTTFYGGNGAGLVYELTPQKKGPPVETVIYEFQLCGENSCPDGIEPWGGLAFDSAGNLYGTTTYGGGQGGYCESGNVDVGCGTVFKLSPAGNNTWNYSIVYASPGGSAGEFLTDDRLFVASDGAIYGTTFDGGDPNGNCPQEILDLGGCGTVFKLTQ